MLEAVLLRVQHGRGIEQYYGRVSLLEAVDVFFVRGDVERNDRWRIGVTELDSFRVTLQRRKIDGGSW